MVTEQYYDDGDVWPYLDTNDLWIYDKLIFSKKMGYACGPKNVETPHPGHYIVRPVSNLMGMGRGAKILWLDTDTWNSGMPEGSFWCEIFQGDHISIDYCDGEPILSVQGHREVPPTPLTHWASWSKTDVVYPLPEILRDVKSRYMNVEFIGGKPIEVHARSNPDWRYHDADEIKVLRNKPLSVPDGYTVLPDEWDTEIRWGIMYR